MLPPRGYIFIGLNIVRALSLVAMVLVFASSIFVMVRDIQAYNEFTKDADPSDLEDCEYIEDSTVPNQKGGIFWAVVNQLLIIFQIIVLVLSEIGWPSRFFDRFFPVLGITFGLGPLGIFQCLIAATVLSHHVDDFTLVAAFFLFSIGCLNILLGLIFRGSARGRRSLFSWRNEGKNILPTTDYRPPFARPQSGFVSSLFSGTRADDAGMPEKRGDGFGAEGERKSRLRGAYRRSLPIQQFAYAPRILGFSIGKPMEAAAKYAKFPGSRTANSRAGTPEPLFKSSNTAI
ncbi:hypothetical protein NM688_g3630 [Phlebia brevispora]|uniref:Uncharacterized protein n=1 Tax=Phlebia brevispora TaxID=194682 RepID=A0ACC1T5D8_9APHY|nr:hypothetical protein NM688_g3630 [Phlebia brevispora]